MVGRGGGEARIPEGAGLSWIWRGRMNIQNNNTFIKLVSLEHEFRDARFGSGPFPTLRQRYNLFTCHLLFPDLKNRLLPADIFESFRSSNPSAFPHEIPATPPVFADKTRKREADFFPPTGVEGSAADRSVRAPFG